MENKLRSFTGRESLVEGYYLKAISGSGALGLTGEMGCGKTVILCKIAERLQKEQNKVFTFFTREEGRNNSVEVLVRQILHYMEKQVGIKWYWRAEKERRMENSICLERVSGYWESKGEKKTRYDICLERLKELCSILQEKIYICIDDMDYLVSDGNLKDIMFLMKSNKLQMIWTCRKLGDLPVEMEEGVQEEKITLLTMSERDKVIDSISKVYNYDICKEIKQEMLKKKNIKNPLYISVLIRYLGVMNKEGEKLYSEEETVEYGANLIREMPEELEEAIVVTLKAVADRITSNSRGVQEILYFLAVSLSGLRISDIQSLFTRREEFCPVSAFVFFLKYMDGIFYIRDGEWIAFSHKMIREKVCKEMIHKERYEEEIKEYVKTLNFEDYLRVQEGWYYFGVGGEDKTTEEEAKRDAELDEYEARTGMRVIGRKSAKRLEVRKANCSGLKAQAIYHYSSGYHDPIDWRAKNSYEKAVKCTEEIHVKQPSESSLYELYCSYRNMGKFFCKQGNPYTSLEYYEKAKECVLNEMWPQETRLRELAVIYESMGKAILNTFLPINTYDLEKALLKVEKAAHYKEKMHGNKFHAKLYDSYNNMGYIQRELGNLEQAIAYYKNAVCCKEEQYEDDRSEKTLQELFLSYHRVGDVLCQNGSYEEALYYYQKGLDFKKEHRERYLQELYISYSNMAYVFWQMKDNEKALIYYNDALRCVQESCEIWENENNLWDLGISYSNIGYVYQDMGQLEDATVYFEKAFQKMRKVV